MLLDKIPNASSTAYLTLSFLQPSGRPATPERLVYRIEDQTPGHEGEPIRGDTTLAVSGPSIVITLSPSDNAITDPARENLRRLVFVAPYNGGDDQVTGEVDWRIRRLSTLPSL
jgi:hypothetical protein